MTRVSSQRSVAVALTATLLAVLAVIGGGTHAGQRQHRLSAAPVHVGVTGTAAVHQTAPHAPLHDHGHLDLAATLPSQTAAAVRDAVDDRATIVVSATSTSASAHDSRAPPTA